MKSVAVHFWVGGREVTREEWDGMLAADREQLMREIREQEMVMAKTEEDYQDRTAELYGDLYRAAARHLKRAGLDTTVGGAGQRFAYQFAEEATAQIDAHANPDQRQPDGTQVSFSARS